MNTFSSGAWAACHLAFLVEDPLRGSDGRCSGDAVVTARWSGSAGGASRRCSPPSLIGLGFEVENNNSRGEPRNLSRQSPPPLYRLRDGGPPASSWAGPPIRARGQGTSCPLGQLVEINSNILPLDLLLYFHLYIFYFFSYFITD